jgi:hypothetical protein
MQTEVRQGDNIRLRRTSGDTDKTNTEQQRSQFAVVEDDEQLIVDYEYRTCGQSCKGSTKKVVGGNKNKRKQMTPARARLVTLGSGKHTNNPDDSSFVPPEEDGNGDEDSKAPKERVAVRDDSSDDGDSDG